MQNNGKLANDRYTYVRKNILAPLVLQQAPSLVCTSLRHCQHVVAACTHSAYFTVSWGNFFSDWPISVLGHGHVFKVWILISSGSDIIIQIRTRGFGVI